VRSRREKSQTAQSAPTPTSPVRDHVEKLITEINARVKSLVADENSKTALLDYFLGSPDLASYKPGSGEEECKKRALDFLKDHQDINRMFEETAEVLIRRLATVKNEAEEKSIALFTTQNTSALSEDSRTDNLMWLARHCLAYYYHNYEDYDLLMYPLLHESDVGEADVIDIIRVSPEDATQLIDERKTKCYKLAGTALGHFGAFLQKSWRENDILWGRLDGAERIIDALLPNHPLRKQLVGEAHAEIVYETIKEMGKEERFELLAEAMMRTNSRTAELEDLTGFVNNLLGNCAHNTDLRAKLDALIQPAELRQFYKNSFELRSKLEPKTALRSAARSTTVIGKIFESLSSERQVKTKYALWIARLGQIFWALVEVSVPRSMLNLIFRHWLKLVYFLEALLIVGSTLLVAKEVQHFALTAFGVTAAVHLAVVILGDLMQSKRRWANIAKMFALVVIVLLIALGGLTLSTFFGVHFAWVWIEGVKIWSEQNSRTLWFSFAAIVVLVFLWTVRNDVKDLVRGD